jgi:hypothetical protein
VNAGSAGAAETSRDSAAGAGWECESSAEPGGRSGRFSWLNPVPLWQSRNDRLVRVLGDPINERRVAWMRQLGRDGSDLVVDRRRERTSFVVLGDTGEGDESQRAVVRALGSRAEEADFMFICSDVIYPAGGVEEYGTKFFEPYAKLEAPIYAIPGNHDWYDDGHGFMRWLCGAEEPPPPNPGFSPKGLLRRLLWRRAPRPDPAVVARLATMRPPTGQPAPYFAIDAGPVLLVGIDTGITGTIDTAQAAWLRHISASKQPKILLTGKPIYVDGEHHPGRIEDSEETVDDIVTATGNNYVAAIGGDIHNYQRYPVRVEDGRTILYLVSGGGGAFTHATHRVPNIDTTPLADRTSEKLFRCYPLRGDSLSLYSKLYAAKLIGRLFGARSIPPDQAAAIVGKRLGIAPTRASARELDIDPGAAGAANALMGLPGRGRGALHLPFSEWLDWDRPPLFKSFLHIDSGPGEIGIRCFTATGCVGDGERPPEDDLRWTAAAGWQLP